MAPRAGRSSFKLRVLETTAPTTRARHVSRSAQRVNKVQDAEITRERLHAKHWRRETGTLQKENGCKTKQYKRNGRRKGHVPGAHFHYDIEPVALCSVHGFYHEGTLRLFRGCSFLQVIKRREFPLHDSELLWKSVRLFILGEVGNSLRRFGGGGLAFTPGTACRGAYVVVTFRPTSGERRA